MPYLAEPLVGRTSELSALDNALSEIEGKSASAFAVLGEPGIGKTRLLAELCERAGERGHVVLPGSASELEQELPFWVFVDAVDEYVRGIEARRLSGLDDDDRAQLGNVFPAFEADAAGVGAGLQDERFRTHRAVRRLLELLAAPKPVVLVLDDMHWADAGAVELLGSLLRRPPAAPVLIAVAARPRQLPARLSAAMDRATRAGAMRDLELGALSAGEARQLLGDAVDDRTVASLHAASGGNPFYLEQLARASQPVAETDGRVSLSGAEVPRGVAAALAEEFALLADGERRLLEGASVAGDPFEPELAAAAAAIPEDHALGALDELLRRDLVRATDVPRRFRFRHPLVRAAVYDGAPGAWRLGAHERCADALRARGAPPIERARHVERSARRGDGDAVDVLREAARAAAQRAPDSSSRLYAAALRVLPETAPGRLELLSALADAHAAAGHFNEAHAAVVEGLALLPADAVAQRLRLTAACAVLESLLGHHHQAHGRLTTVLDGLSDAGSPEAVALMLALQLDGFYRRDYRSMRDWTQRALAAAQPLGDRSLTASAASTLALASVLAGDTAAARGQRDAAQPLVAALSDDELARHLDAAGNLARVEVYLDRYDAGGALAERTLAVARAGGHADVFPVPYWVGTIRFMRGRLAEAAELLDAVVEAARVPGYPEVLGWSLMTRSLTASAAGDTDTALECAEDSLAVAQELDAGPLLAWCGAAAAAALLAAGEPRRATETLTTSAGGPQLPDMPGPWRVNFLELLTRCRLAGGERDEAVSAAASAEIVADALGLRVPRAMADRALAAVALDHGDAATAAARALASAETATEVGAAVEGALSQVLAGQALAAAGDRARAAAELERAAATLDACGAPAQRAAAERELGRLGVRPHRRTRPGKRDASTAIDALTGRELEVARLVVDRKTNAEIAAELFLSQKTVETHIRNLFHKLSVSSRVEVARVVERADRERIAAPG